MKHNFSPIQNSLEHLLKKYRLYESFEEHRLFNEWKFLVGDKIAAVSRPTGFNPDTKRLTIKLQSESWKNEFKKHEKKLLNQLNSELRTLEISEIVFE